MEKKLDKDPTIPLLKLNALEQPKYNNLGINARVALELEFEDQAMNFG